MPVGVSGRTLLLKMNSEGSPATYVTVAALRDTTITVGETEADTTNKDSAGVRQLLDGNILSSITVSGTGVFTDVAILAAVRTAAMTGVHRGFEIDVDDSGSAAAGGVYAGSFRITSFEEAGAHDGEINYSITLTSDGTVSFT